MLWNQNSKKSSWWGWQVLWCCGIVLTVVPVTWDNRYLGLGSQHQSHPASPSNQHRAHIQSALQSSYCSWLAGLLSVAPQQRRLPGMTSAATSEDVSEILKSVLVPQSPPNRCDHWSDQQMWSKTNSEWFSGETGPSSEIFSKKLSVVLC